MVTSALEADALEVDLLMELDFHPGPVMVADMPHVPRLATWAKQVLRVVANSMVLSSNPSSCVEVVSLEAATNDRLNNWLSDGLLESRLLIARLDCDLHLSCWLLVDRLLLWERLLLLGVRLLLWIWLLIAWLSVRLLLPVRLLLGLLVTWLLIWLLILSWLSIARLRLDLNLDAWLLVSLRLAISSRLLVAGLRLNLHLHAGLLETWLNVRLLETRLDTNSSNSRSVMEEDNFAELESLSSVSIVEIESYFLRVAVDLGECDSVPSHQTKAELSVGNLVPASSKHVEGVDAHFGGRLARVVASALKADALEVHLLHEFDFDPGSLVVSDVPLVPLFLAWAEQVLWVAADSMVFSNDSCCSVEVVPLETTDWLDLNLHSERSLKY